MGLDMYLKKETYIGAEYKHRNVEAKVEITINGVKVPIDVKKLSIITESFGYWRKSNHIHNWFVNNVQDGEDDCGDYEVSKEQLQELLDTCNKVLKDKSLAEELLPTTEGFFFGSINYDEYYFNDIKDTVKLLKQAIKELDASEGLSVWFTYYSSW